MFSQQKNWQWELILKLTRFRLLQQDLEVVHNGVEFRCLWLIFSIYTDNRSPEGCVWLFSIKRHQSSWIPAIGMISRAKRVRICIFQDFDLIFGISRHLHLNFTDIFATTEIVYIHENHIYSDIYSWKLYIFKKSSCMRIE